MGVTDRRWRSAIGYGDGNATVGLGLWLAGTVMGVAAIGGFVLAGQGTGLDGIGPDTLGWMAVLTGGMAIPLALLGTITLLNDERVALVATPGAVVPMLVSGTYVNRGTMAWVPSTEVLQAAYGGGLILLLVALGVAAAVAPDPATRSAATSSPSGTATTAGTDAIGPAGTGTERGAPGTGSDADAVEAIVASSGDDRDDAGTDDAAAGDGDAAESDGDAIDTSDGEETAGDEPSADDLAAWFGDDSGEESAGVESADGDGAETGAEAEAGDADDEDDGADEFHWGGRDD